MTNKELEAQRQTILHYWLNGIRTAKEIYTKTKIPIRTIQYNIKKLKEKGTVKHIGGNSRRSKVTRTVLRSIGQLLHHNSAITTRQLAVRIQDTHNVSISHINIWRHMAKKGYNSAIPLSTPMLTSSHIDARKTWAQTHLNDNWDYTIFTDETAFDLFRNKISRWYKNGERPVRRLPKSRQKVMAWGGISLDGKTPLFCFTGIMDGPFYVNILQTQLLPAA